MEAIKDNKYCVYKHTNKFNNKVYIGMTSTNIDKRAGLNGRNYNKNILFNRAILKYGWDNFEHDVLYNNLSKNDAAMIEQNMIAKYQSNNPTYGYNLSTGGESGNYGCHMSEENKVLRKERMSGDKNPMYGKFGNSHPRYGKKQSSKSIEIIRNKELGKFVSDDTKHKISESRIKSKAWDKENNPMYGKTYDKAPQARKIICIETNEQYNCIKYAAEELGIHATSITACCKGKVNSAGGYHWRYA